MTYKSYGGPLRHVSMFSRHLPRSAWLLALLVVIGLAAGIFEVTLANYHSIQAHVAHILIGGVLTGLLAVILPAVLTVLVLKFARRYVYAKYILFATVISSTSYSVFLVLGGALYTLTGLYYTSIIIILLGDASIFSWWVFVNKLLLHRQKSAAALSLVQPTLNTLFFIPASRLMLAASIPLGFLLVKLYAGIFVFLVMTYVILYIVDSPLRRSLGYSGIDVFGQMLQNWLFNINVAIPKRNNSAASGMRVPIDTHTIVVKGKAGKVKAVFFVPNIHYGPVGTLGSSNFPQMLERFGSAELKAPTFIMHTAVSDDYNAVSSDQYGIVRRAFHDGVKECSEVKGGTFGYAAGSSGDSKIKSFVLGNVGLALLTRAPKVTEDITPEAAAVIRRVLEKHFEHPVLIDAHNSRYESAPKSELDTIKFNSSRLDEYIAAANSMEVKHRSKHLRFGSAAVELHRLHGQDLAPGALNVAVFSIGGFRHAVLQFNANNMLPQMRQEILDHVHKKYGIEAEVLTTDTHYVNSLGSTASNVLGRSTRFARLAPYIDSAINQALAGMENASVFYKHGVMDKFRVWGSNERERMITALDSMIAPMKVLVPAVIAAGFFVAAWIIYFI